ncbi:MAG: response regulator, partial [Campylobacteraceae bacterium]|nr:response regulator [Campylobacteraceae bacterium]
MESKLIENISVLYVEDDDDIRNVFGRYLKRKIKNVILAVNGQEGYKLYKEHKPDLVVTDINMPIMSGLEMSSIIRDENSEIPIIITSAHSDTHFFQEAINIGVNMFLLKPVDMTQLYNTIKITSEDIYLKIKTQKDEKIIN